VRSTEFRLIRIKTSYASTSCMRTPALLTLDRSISELNTYFVLSELYARDFWARNADIAAESPDQLLTVAFPNNPSAKQINIPLRSLKIQSDQYESFLIQQVISRCSEAAKDYFDWIENFNIAMFGVKRDSELSFFDGIAKQVGVPIASLTDQECIWTLDHLRSRRNCLVHREANANSAFKDLCRQKGDRLDKYWSKRLAPRRDARVDFKDADPGNIDSQTFLDLLHFTRLSAETFDKNYCLHLPKPKLERHIESEFDKQVGSKKMLEAKRKKKLTQFGLRLFDYQFFGHVV
jgi:hypothetical protein